MMTGCLRMTEPAKPEPPKRVRRCGDCHGPVIATTTDRLDGKQPPIPCYGCRACRSYWVPGHKEGFRVGPGNSAADVGRMIRLVLGNTQQDKISQDEAMTAPFLDPRWDMRTEFID